MNDTTNTDTIAPAPKLGHLTTTELALVRLISPGVHADVLATAEGAAKLREPLTEDPATESYIRQEAKQHRLAVLAAERALGARAGLEWAELRRLHPVRAERLAEALVAAARADQAAALASDEELGTALARQAEANSLAGQLCARARKALATNQDESFPAWLEGFEARKANAAAAVDRAAAALAEAGALRAKAREAEERARHELDVLQHSAASLVRRLKRNGQPMALALSHLRCNDGGRLGTWLDAGLTVDQAKRELDKLVDRYVFAFEQATGREDAA